MQITVDSRAVTWFSEEMGRPDGTGIRFGVQIYGNSPVQNGFALAVEPDKPVEIGAQFQADNGLLFYVEAADVWFFDGHDLQVQYNEELHEPSYQYVKPQ
ncbi:hypothetical protein CL176_05220 [Suicoccus acidiformans]|uniref:Iron-sulfur cluster biosynthesis protein n=1 Tax=Suicoccus acidiformans TaxID=2036206 RepID=A0A347WK40_9LACT|nr:hypothetical protein [Suicoccus acidiformans]AXY25447.1 hypothetical protein CL176_05220 [Suicoccus acidiformans]